MLCSKDNEKGAAVKQSLCVPAWLMQAFLLQDQASRFEFIVINGLIASLQK